MNQIPYLRIFTYGIVESLIFLFAIHIYSFTPLKKRSFMLYPLVFLVYNSITLVSRLIPVAGGVNMILNAIFYTLIPILIFKIELQKSILAVIGFILSVVTAEILVSLFVKHVLGMQISVMKKDLFFMIAFALGTGIIVGLILLIFYFTLYKKKVLVAKDEPL